MAFLNEILNPNYPQCIYCGAHFENKYHYNDYPRPINYISSIRYDCNPCNEMIEFNSIHINSDYTLSADRYYLSCMTHIITNSMYNETYFILNKYHSRGVQFPKFDIPSNKKELLNIIQTALIFY